MASGRMAPTDSKSGCNVDPTLIPDSRLGFRPQVRQTHRTHGTQGIIFADEVYGWMDNYLSHFNFARKYSSQLSVVG